MDEEEEMLEYDIEHDRMLLVLVETVQGMIEARKQRRSERATNQENFDI